MHVLLVGGLDVRFQTFIGMDCVFSVIQTPDSVGEYQRQLTDRISVVADFSGETVLSSAKAINALLPVDFVYSFFEEGLLSSAYAAKELGLKGMDYASCEICVDKSIMRNFLRGTRFELKHAYCSTLPMALDFYRTSPGGVVLKSARGTGSLNVSICKNEEDVVRAWDINTSDNETHVLVEEYLDGEEYSLETLSLNGKHEFLGATKKFLYKDTLVERHHIFPAPDLCTAQVSALSDFCRELLDKIGYKHGPCHIEVKILGDAIKLVEINNRSGGDFIWKMVELVTGVDLISETIVGAVGTAKGRAPRAEVKKYNRMASRALFSKIDIDSVSKLSGSKFEVVEIASYEPEANDGRIRSSFDRFGFVVIGDVPGVPFSDSFQELDSRISSAEAQFGR